MFDTEKLYNPTFCDGDLHTELMRIHKEFDVTVTNSRIHLEVGPMITATIDAYKNVIVHLLKTIEKQDERLNDLRHNAIERSERD